MFEEFKHIEGCWVWMRPKTPHQRYGKVMYKGKRYSSHRLSWILTNGPIPDGMCVCHKCDIPRCVNPSHLFLGTMKDNTQDMIKKGRDGYEKLRKQLCIRGHSYTYPKVGRKHCKQCLAITNKNRYLTQKKEKAHAPNL